MKNQVTTIEQSRRLMELGVPAEKASMVWRKWIYQHFDRDVIDEVKYELDVKESRVRDSEESDIPAYTVADLLEKVLPDSIATHNNMHVLTLGAMVGGGRWCVEYTPALTELEAENIGDEFGGDLIALLCDRCEWLVSNGYKLEV